MESLVIQLESLFEKATADLDYVTRKLDTELDVTCSQNQCDHLNPVRLMKRLQALNANVAALKERNERIVAQKERMFVMMRDTLVTTSRSLPALQVQAGIQVTGGTESSHTHFASSSFAQSSNNDGMMSRPQDQPAVAVSEAEFLAVSELVRGRVKLEEVNKVYEVIFSQFTDKKRASTPLTVSDMTDLGLKITGATGEAKLKVLRAIKIISMNKDGVLLL